MQNFENKVVFVTGATSGIGREIALEYARNGARVAFTGRRDELGQSLKGEIEALSTNGLFIKSDVKNDSDVKLAVAQTVAQFGRIDIAVNNAGIEEQMAPFLEQTVHKFDEVMGTNVRGMWFCLQAEIRQMLTQNSDCAIVNMSSIAGQLGLANVSTYVASKHAVNGLTKSLASEFASQRIRINAVAPGPIKTEMWDRFAKALPDVEKMVPQMVPTGRVGQCSEVASCVLWLTSATATYVTGQIIAVDGGMVNI